MAIDRRVARTRTALYEALIALIRERDYETISVEEILQQANVGRSTFYAHFTSKDDLLKNSLERLKALLIAARDEHRAAVRDGASEEVWDPSRALFEHVYEFTDIQLALAGGRGAAVVGAAVDNTIAEVLRDSFPAQPVDGVPRELAIRHIVATFNTILHWWLRAQGEVTPAEADRLFKTLLLNGLPEGWRHAFMASFGAKNDSGRAPDGPAHAPDSSVSGM